MKNLLRKSLMLVALLGILFTSCKKEYDTPPIAVLPVGTVYTINEILAMESGTVFNDDASVYGIITADEVSGNLYKAAFLQDRETGKALELYMDATSGVRIGDSVRVYLKGVTYMMYNNLPQLANFEPDGHIVILANDLPIEPAVTTIAEVTTGKYLAGLIKLEDVYFTSRALFADPAGYGNRTLRDQSGNEITVRTSNYANFANDSVPGGTGSVIAIASVYNSTWQLLIRSAKELEFEGYTPGGGVAGEVQPLPYYQSFSTDFGTYMTYDVLGDQSWEIDYNTAKMTGYANSVNYANEDWLISSPVDLSGASDITMNVSYIARYFSSLNDDITVWASTDYQFGNDPATARWEQVPASWTSGSDWATFASTDVNLSAYAGQTITVAVKYLSTDVKAGTIEVKSITIEQGGVTPPTPPTPGGEVQSMPYYQSFANEFGTYTTYDVLGAESWMIDYQTAKMTGYVGGTNYADEDWLISSPVALTGVSEAKMSMTYIARYFSNLNSDITVQVSTDYVWESNPTTATWTNVPASWTSGSDWTTFATTDVDLTQFVGQTITVAVKYLSTEAKAGTIEVQSITIQEGGGVTPPTPPTPPGPGTGSGTADDPYNVGAGINAQGQDIIGWVQGYIVGAVKSGLTSVSSNADINWSAPFDLATNVLIADDANCTEVSQCIIVNLPAGKPLRTEVNLMDNPGNLGKLLAVKGKLRTYFGQAGLRDSGGTVNDFVLEGGGVTPPEPGNPGELQSLPYNQMFTTSFGTYITYDVNGAQSWMIDYSTAKMTGFVNPDRYANEDWLISSPVDLGNVNNATMTLNYIARYFDNVDDEITVWISTDYNFNSNPTSATWSQLPAVWTVGEDWNTFYNTDVDLSQYAGRTVYVAVKYISTEEAAGTIEIKSINIH